MMITASICLLLGAVLGLKFNFKMVLHAIVLACLIWSAVAILGKVSVGSAVLLAIVSAVTFQTGYCVSLVIAALGLTGNEQPAASMRSDAAGPFEAPGEFGKNT